MGSIEHGYLDSDKLLVLYEGKLSEAEYKEEIERMKREEAEKVIAEADKVAAEAAKVIQQEEANDDYKSFASVDTYAVSDNAYDTAGSDPSRTKVYYWIQNRYDYYDEVLNNGVYSGEKYTTCVFDDASSNFGISLQKVWLLYNDYCMYH
jgi:hypothetical protein